MRTIANERAGLFSHPRMIRSSVYKWITRRSASSPYSSTFLPSLLLFVDDTCSRASRSTCWRTLRILNMWSWQGVCCDIFYLIHVKMCIFMRAIHSTTQFIFPLITRTKFNSLKVNVVLTRFICDFC